MRVFLILCCTFIFGAFLYKVANIMIKDKNAFIRFLGFVLAIATAIVIFCLILYFGFDINVIKMLQ